MGKSRSEIIVGIEQSPVALETGVGLTPGAGKGKLQKRTHTQHNKLEEFISVMLPSQLPSNSTDLCLNLRIRHAAFPAGVTTSVTVSV